ncbi:hypothetical protein [Nocardioides halotolerans]|uniref:hypothetical protein n=1 Tax=Nocardioides halotolerans TaxID=433660 RepID=UPI00048B1D18|nr:hypothetical protein [Nocardioides halotolerans]
MNDAVLAGGFALAGVITQQVLAMVHEGRKHTRDRTAQLAREQHEALVQLVTAGRRVQRALVDRDRSADDASANQRLAVEVDRLTEAAVVVRLVVPDKSLVSAVEQFEDRAKRLEDNTHARAERLELTQLLEEISRFEGRANQS